MTLCGGFRYPVPFVEQLHAPKAYDADEFVSAGDVALIATSNPDGSCEDTEERLGA